VSVQNDRLRDLDRLLARVGPLLRWRHVIVWVVAFVFAAHYLRGNQPEWEFFYDGSRLLTNSHPFTIVKPGGLHLYANYPYYQIGPLGLLAALPFRMMGYDAGRLLATLAMTAVAPLLIFVLERTASRVWPTQTEAEEARRRFTVLLGGVLVVQSWTSLAVVYPHLDDVLVLSAAVFALWAIPQQRWLLTGLMLGVAVAAKPWGIILLPLVLVLPKRKGLRALLVAGAVTAAAWGSFVLADTGTLRAGRVWNPVSAGSVIHLFGAALGTNPAWVRPAQFGLALLAGCWLVSKGRWGAVILVGIALRIALDTQIVLYYDTGLVLAAFAWDLLRTRRPIPMFTAITFGLVNVTHGLTTNNRLQAAFHLAASVVVVILLLGRDMRDAQPPPQAYNTSAAPHALPPLAMESPGADEVSNVRSRART